MTWIPYLRKRLADITNVHLARSSINRQLDPRTYEEMGICRKPQAKLGTATSALEAIGHPTSLGADNAAIEWDDLISRNADQAESLKQETIADAGRRKTKARLTVTTPPALQDVEVLLEQWLTDELAAQERLALANDVEVKIDRALSRARKTVAINQKVITAIDAGSAKPSEAKNRPKLVKARNQGNAYIDHMREVADAAYDLIRDFRAEAAQIQDGNKLKLRDIDALVAGQSVTGSPLTHDVEQLNPGRTPDPLPPRRADPGRPNGDARYDNVARPKMPENLADERQPSALTGTSAEVSAAEFDAMFNQLARRPVRWATTNGKLVPNKEALDAAGFTLRVLSSDPMQRRLHGLARMQERERKRLESYARSRPFGFVEAAGGITLDDRSPVGLRVLHNKWWHDPDYQSQLRQILHAAQRPPLLVPDPAIQSKSPKAPVIIATVTTLQAELSIETGSLADALVAASIAARTKTSGLARPPVAEPRMPDSVAPRPGMNRLGPEQVERATNFGPVQDQIGAPTTSGGSDSVRVGRKLHDGVVTSSAPSAGDDQRRQRQAQIAKQHQLDRGR